MSHFKLGLFLLLGLIITSCSTYQKHFGGTSHEYKNAQAGKKLQPANKETNLNKTNRYTIPEIPEKWTGPIKEQDIAPPDYANPEAK